MYTEKIVFIRDFVHPSAVDSAPGIRAAIQKAIETNADKVIFEGGRYILKSFITIKTEGIVHDAGSQFNDTKDCHITISGSKKLGLEGAVGNEGEPATVLVGYNDCINHSLLPAIIWCEDCDNLTLKNIAFTRGPEYASAGVVIAKTTSSITVEVFKGNACYNGMGTYCMNRFNPITGALVGESVTYGGGAVINWNQIGNNTLMLQDEKVASKVELGDHLSWHQGAQTEQLRFN